MEDIVKRNIDTGKLLIVGVVLLSLSLMVQLFAVGETITFDEGFNFSWLGASIATSYVLSSVSMIIVLQEFFQVKRKLRGMLALNVLLEKPGVEPVLPELIEPKVEKVQLIELEEESEEPLKEPIEETIEDPLEELLVDPDAEFDSLLEDLDDEMDEPDVLPSIPIDEDIVQRYKTTKVKIDEETGEMEPIIDDGGLQELIAQADLASDEEQQLAKIVAESEIIQTLNELETIVKELKARQSG
jgi:hypothetical protein